MEVLTLQEQIHKIYILELNSTTYVVELIGGR